MQTKQLSLEELLEAGVQFGHKTSKWHPKMEKFKYANERVIAYELYHQMRVIQESNRLKEWNSSEMCIQGELYKIAQDLNKYPGFP